MTRLLWLSRLSALALLCVTAVLASAAIPEIPASAATPALRFVTPVMRTLANGMQVAVFPQKRQGMVQVQLMVPAGLTAESPAHPGVASLTAQLLRQGTASRSAEQFAGDLERLGGVFNVGVTHDAAMVAGGFRSQDFAAGLELLSDAVLNPAFDEERFELTRRQSAQQLGAVRRNGSAIADERLWAAVFGPHPYAKGPSGEIDLLARSRVEHLRAFHRDRWRPDRAVLAVSGDVTPEEVFAAAEERFGRWAGQTQPDPVRPEPQSIPGVRVIDTPEAPTAEVRWGAVAPGRADPALASWNVLVAALNERNALPPGARAQLVTLKDASLFLISASARFNDVAQTADRVRAAVDSLATSPPTGTALATLQRMVAGAWALRLESPGAQLTAWMNAQASGQPVDELSRAAARFADSALSADPAAAAIALRQRARLLVVAPTDSVQIALARFGKVESEPVDRPMPVERDTLPAPSVAELQTGRALADKAIVAHGGLVRLRGVKSLVMEGDLLVSAESNEISGQFSVVRVAPSRMVFVNKMFDFESKQVLDGDKGWMLAQADTVTITDADSVGVVSLQSIFESDMVHTLLAAQAPGSQVAARGRERLKNVDCLLVDFLVRNGERRRLVLDAATHRVVAIDGALGGDLVWHERRVFHDTRLAGGVLYPHTEQRFVDGVLLTTTHLRSIGINVDVDQSIFRKPFVRGGQILGQ